MIRATDEGGSFSRRLGRALVMGGLVATGLALPDIVRATTFRVRTLSLGRANHQIAPRRRGMIPERVYTQGATLDIYDLLDEKTGSLNAHLDVRYSTDFALSGARRDDSLYATAWNRLDLSTSYLHWRPVRGVELTGGRQWSRGSLGIRDFDGLHLELGPRLAPDTHGRIVVYGGREVQRTTEPFNPDARDVPGIPIPRRTSEPEPGTPLIAGGTLGLRWAEGARFDVSYRRRWRTTPTTSRVGSERLGLATSLRPVDSTTVTANVAYHTLLATVDRAEFDLLADLPDPVGEVTAGVARRRPWFDSASIFNIFGARPHREARLGYHHRVPAIASEFGVRGWGRIYDGDPRFDGLWGNERSLRRLGGALDHEATLHLLRRTLRWRSELSWETDPGRPRGDHVLADTRLRAPVLLDDLFLVARLAYLAVRPTERGRRAGNAFNYLLGADLPVADLGTVSVTAEWATGPVQPNHLNLFAALELQFWR